MPSMGGPDAGDDITGSGGLGESLGGGSDFSYGWDSAAPYSGGNQGWGDGEGPGSWSLTNPTGWTTSLDDLLETMAGPWNGWQTREDREFEAGRYARNAARRQGQWALEDSIISDAIQQASQLTGSPTNALRAADAIYAGDTASMRGFGLNTAADRMVESFPADGDIFDRLGDAMGLTTAENRRTRPENIARGVELGYVSPTLDGRFNPTAKAALAPFSSTLGMLIDMVAPGLSGPARAAANLATDDLFAAPGPYDVPDVSGASFAAGIPDITPGLNFVNDAVGLYDIGNMLTDAGALPTGSGPISGYGGDRQAQDQAYTDAFHRAFVQHGIPGLTMAGLNGLYVPRYL